MPLADTSVWISHFRDGSEELSDLLETGEVVCHPLVVAELACGHLHNWATILALMQVLPQAPVAGHDELLRVIDARKMWGKGLGHGDVQLLASALLGGTSLWTPDKCLGTAAEHLGCRYSRNGAYRGKRAGGDFAGLNTCLVSPSRVDVVRKKGRGSS